jgi:hypothetical protein
LGWIKYGLEENYDDATYSVNDDFRCTGRPWLAKLKAKSAGHFKRSSLLSQRETSTIVGGTIVKYFGWHYQPKMTSSLQNGEEEYYDFKIGQLNSLRCANRYRGRDGNNFLSWIFRY